MATDLVNAGTHPFVTQQLLGHKNLATTRRYYRWNLKQSREAFEHLQSYREGS